MAAIIRKIVTSKWFRKSIKWVFEGINVILKIVGLVNDKKAAKESEDNFRKVFDGLNENYNAIKYVELKVDRNYEALKKIAEMIRETALSVENTRKEMHAGFNIVIKAIRQSSIGPTISKLNTVIQYFLSEKQWIEYLLPDEKIAKLEEKNGILLHLKDSRTPKENSLSTLLNYIIDQKYAIPENADDELAFSALYILYYGTQTYVSIMFFLIEQYSYLADYHYERSNIEKYNEYFDSIKINFQDFKHSLVGSTGVTSLIDSVIDVLNTVQRKKIINDTGENSSKRLSERIKSLVSIKQQIQQMELPIITDVPDKLTGKPEFKKQDIKTPIVDWKDGSKVSYAIQFKLNDTYSKVGEWSDPLIVSGKANPYLEIPVDLHRRTRVIFRKFNDDTPQLVGVLENIYQTTFRDINRDLYNAASRWNENIAINEIDVLKRNGADINAIFSHGRRAIHAAAESGISLLDLKLLINKNSTDINVKDEDGCTPIYIAAEAGHNEFIKLLIDNGADVNVKIDSDNSTPLHIAAYKGFVDPVKTLIRSSTVDVNAKNEEGFTALHNAVFGGVLVLKVLASNSSVDVNTKSKEGLTPLHLASINKYQDVAEALLETKRVDINCGAAGNLTALHFASMLGHIEMVKFLSAQNDTNVNAQSVNNWTPLHFAISEKKEDVAFELLKMNNTNVNLKGEYNITPLHIAVSTAQENVVLHLLERKASVEDETKEGLRPLHLAAMFGNRKMMSTFIEHGANIEAKTHDGLTPLHYIALSRNSNLHTFMYLVNKGASLNSVPNSNETFLHLASGSGNFELVKYLVTKNYSVNAKDKDGNTPLYSAARNGQLEVVQYLVEEKNVNINITNNAAHTVLHEAASSEGSNLDTIKYLINKGIPLTYKNGSSENFVHLAARSGSLVRVLYFSESNSNIDAGDDDHNTPLYIAAENGYMDIIKYLINVKNANIDARNNDGKTVLHLASSTGDMSLVKYFIEQGADINAKSNNGLSPLLFSAKNGYLDMVKYFVEEQKIDLNVVCNIGSRPLAAYYNHLDIVKYLKNKENQRFADINNFISLAFATQNGHLEIVKYFIDFLHYRIDENIASFTYGIMELMNKHYINDISYETTINFVFIFFSAIFEFMKMNNDNHIEPSDNRTHIILTVLAAQCSQLDVVKYFVEEKHVDVNNTKGTLGESLSDYAAANGDIEMIRYFLFDKRVDFNNENNDMTPLFYAVVYDHFEVVKYLFEKGVSVNLTSSCGRTPLIYAAANGNLNMIKYFVDRGASILYNPKNCVFFPKLKPLPWIEDNSFTETEYYDDSPLSNAVKNGHFSVVKYLVEKGADVNRDMLEVAAEKGHFEIVKYFVDKSYNYSGTLLHYAAASGNLNLVKYMVGKGISVDYVISRRLTTNLTPLHFAAENGHLNIVKYLVDEKQAYVSAVDSYQWTPLHYAANNGHLEVVKYIVDEKHVNPYVKAGVFQRTPLNCALNNGHTSVAAYIAEKVVYSNRYGSDERNLLIVAAVDGGSLSTVKYLLDQTKDPNFSYSTGALSPNMPLLHRAIVKNRFDAVKLLIEMNADINIRCSFGLLGPDLTPLIRATFYNLSSIAKYLIDKGADIEAKTESPLPFNSNLTALHVAAANENLDMVEYLVAKGVDIHTKIVNDTLIPSQVAHLCCNTVIADFLELQDYTRNRRNNKLKDLPTHYDKEDFVVVKNYQDANISRVIGEFEGKTSKNIEASFEQTGETSASVRTTIPYNRELPSSLSKVQMSLHDRGSLPEETLNTTSSMTDIYIQPDVAGLMLLLPTFINSIGRKFVLPLFSVNHPVSLLEAQGCALNITVGLQKVVEVAALKSRISLHRLNINKIELQKVTTSLIMDGKYDKIATVLVSYVKKACPSRETGYPGKLSPKKYNMFITLFSNRLDVIVNQSIHQLLNNRNRINKN